MWHRNATLTLVLLLFIVGQAEAGIQPSFWVDSCAWTATHIVVIDEAGSVVESLKGNLAPGFRVPLDQLKMPTQEEIDQALKSIFAAKKTFNIGISMLCNGIAQQHKHMRSFMNDPDALFLHTILLLWSMANSKAIIKPNLLGEHSAT